MTKPVRPWQQPTEQPATEAAWVAGFFDGEGTVYAHRSGPRRYLNLTIANTDMESLERCQRVLGGAIYERRVAADRLPMFVLKVARQPAVEAALALLDPYLSGKRQQQLATARALVGANPPIQPRRGWPRGVPRGRPTTADCPECGRAIGVNTLRQHVQAHASLSPAG